MALTKLPKSGIADDAIDASKIEDGTIQAVEISGTIPAEKLSSTQDYSSKTVTLPNTSVTSDQLANTTIANAKLSNSTFTVRGTSRSLGDSFSIGVDVDWQTVKTADFTAAAGLGYFVNTTSGAVTVTLPASASIGDTIAIKDYAGTFASNNLTIGRNGHNIQGVANDSLISTNRASLVLVYVDSTKGWLYTGEHNVASLLKAQFTSATGGTITTSGDYKIHTFTGDGCFVVSAAGNVSVNPLGGPSVVDYLVLAGGGGADSGLGGGGGAGGFRESHSTPVSGCYTASPLATPTGITITATTYPITVGAGGSAQNTNGSSPGDLGKGSDSVFSTITSTGGGGGTGVFYPVGGSGGSGGGGGGYYARPGGSGNTPPTSPSQGNNGGSGQGTCCSRFGGGGGGATAVGVSSTAGADGGAGATTSISGSPTSYAGGGAAGGAPNSPGTNPNGSGGPFGGGNGGIGIGGVGTNGATNKGAGGGGSGPGTNTSGAGGKGIVIIRYKFQ